MASITLAQAALQSQDPLVRGVVLEIITADAFSAVLPAIPVPGRSYQFLRQATAHGATWTDVGSAVNKTQATVTVVSHPLGRCVGDVEVDEFISTAMTNPNDIAAMHVGLLGAAIANKWRDAVINGSGTFPEPKGLRALTDTSQRYDHGDIGVTATAGVTVSLANLDYLLDAIKAPGQKFLMANRKTIRKFKEAVRTAGTGDTNTVEFGFLNPLTGERGKLGVLSYSGVPFFENDNITTTTVSGQSGRTWIYAGVIGGEGVSIIVPATVRQLVVSDPAFNSETYDLKVWRARLIAGITCRSTKALAYFSNVNNS